MHENSWIAPVIYFGDFVVVRRPLGSRCAIALLLRFYDAFDSKPAFTPAEKTVPHLPEK
jgi:hypothetical protein